MKTRYARANAAAVSGNGTGMPDGAPIHDPKSPGLRSTPRRAERRLKGTIPVRKRPGAVCALSFDLSPP